MDELLRSLVGVQLAVVESDAKNLAVVESDELPVDHQDQLDHQLDLVALVERLALSAKFGRLALAVLAVLADELVVVATVEYVEPVESACSLLHWFDAVVRMKLRDLQQPQARAAQPVLRQLVLVL